MYNVASIIGKMWILHHHNCNGQKKRRRGMDFTPGGKQIIKSENWSLSSKKIEKFVIVNKRNSKNFQDLIEK